MLGWAAQTGSGLRIEEVKTTRIDCKAQSRARQRSSLGMQPRSEDCPLGCEHRLVLGRNTPVGPDSRLIDREQHVCVGAQLLDAADHPALARASGEPLPWSPEIQAGIWRSPGEEVAYADPTPAEQELYYLAALAFGLKGLNFYMLVNRENWEFAPIEPGGAVSSYVIGVRKVVRLISQLPDFGEFEPVTPVALAWQASYARDAYAAGGDAGRSLPYDVMLGAFNALTRAGYPPRIWHTEQPPPSDVAAIVTSTAAHMPREAQDRLAEMSKTIPVILLGEPPHLDEEGQACTVLTDAMNSGSVKSQFTTADMLDAISRSGIEPPVRVVGAEGFAVMHQAGARELLYVMNAGTQHSTFELRIGDGGVTALSPLAGDSAATIVHRTAALDLAPHAGEIFEVTR
jgi:hypothetical protein